MNTMYQPSGSAASDSNMDLLRSNAKESLQDLECLPDFRLLSLPAGLVDHIHTLWSEISSRNSATYTEILEDIIVAQGWLRSLGSHPPQSADDENAANRLYDWAVDLATPSPLFAQVVDREELSDDKTATIRNEKLKSSLAVSVLAVLFRILPPEKTGNAENIVISLASFTSAEDPWTTPESFEESTEVLETFFTETRDEESSSPWSMIEQILRERIRPLFAKTKNPVITAAGRKNFHPVPLPRFDASTLDPESKPWKIHEVYSTTVFAWIISQYSPANRDKLEAHFPLLVPPLLALIDDESLPFKARGCALLTKLLNPIRESKSDILKRTNLSSVFEDAVKPCLLSLPSITQEDDSIHLLEQAYPALISLLKTSYQPIPPQKPQILNEPYLKGLTSLLRDNLIPSFHHISTTNPTSTSSTFASFPHPSLSTFLLNQITALINELTLHTTKYLQDLIPLLHNTLANPFGTTYPPLFLAAIAGTRAVILNAHPRVWRWRAEILSGICSCWKCVLGEEEKGVEGGSDESSAGALWRLKRELMGVVYLLRVALENPVPLVEDEPGVKEAREKISGELDGLVRADGSLGELLVGHVDSRDGSYFGEP